MEFMHPDEEKKLIDEFNKRFPMKVELHVHLDGSVRPETVLAVAKERGMADTLPHQTIEELNKDVVLVGPSSLERLLQSFDYFMPVIAGYQPAISRIAHELCEDCNRHNIRYMEVRYCPHLLSDAHVNPYIKSRGPVTFTPRDVVETVNEALARGMKEFGITVKTILCCLTTIPDCAEEIYQLCLDFKGKGVVGIDQAGCEFDPGENPNADIFKQVFKKALDNGIHRTVHAGEVKSHAAVTEALDNMHAERIGHGYHSYDDKAVYDRIIRDKVHLETCPISSVLTKACEEDPQKHPLKEFVKDGVNYSINTDDPVVLGNTLTDDYKFAQDMGLSDEDIIRGIFNAARSCFGTEEEKQQLLADLEKVYGKH